MTQTCTERAVETETDTGSTYIGDGQGDSER